MENRVETRFYRAPSAEEQKQFPRVLSRLYSEDTEFLEHSMQLSDTGVEHQEQYHIKDTTVSINEDFNNFITITGYSEKIMEAKGFLEKKTGIELEEVKEVGGVE